MSEKVRLSMHVTSALRAELQEMARERGTTVGGLLSDGLASMAAFREQRKLGRNHMGFVADATKLDAQLIFV